MLLALALALAAPPVERPFASCAWVRAEDDGAGGGFVVSVEKRLLVTCRHVVGGRKTLDVFFPWYRDGELVTDRAEYLRGRAALRAQGLLVVGTVLKTSDELDLALIELDSLPAGTTAVAFARPPRPGDPLRVVGHRTDLDTLWNVTAGPLRASGALADGYDWRGKKLARGARVHIGQLPTEEGDSGGPVFDARGELVGVDSALRRACPLAAVVIAADEVRRFAGLDGVPAKKPEPPPIAEALTRATVWVKPTATAVHLAGVLIEPDLVLTGARHLAVAERVGVALPLHAGDRWVSERGTYRDPLALHLQGAWRAGTVLARDPARDLALVRLDSPSDRMKPLALAANVPRAGDALHTLNHPGGLEFAWVYAAGSVRQRGKVALDSGEAAPRVDTLVCQLPAQAGSPGGPLANARGELVGVVASREGAQQVGYAATVDEIRAFLDVALRDRPARALTGLRARIEAIPNHQAALLAGALARRAEEHRAAGRRADAKQDCDTALSLAPGCAAARLCRARMLAPEAAHAELDAAVEQGLFDRDVLVSRAALATAAKDYRKARGDLARVLDVIPHDAEAREGLARAHLGMGDDAKAAAALGDAVRADATRMKSAAVVMRTHADALRQKYPNAPGIAADWLAAALAAVGKGTRDPTAKGAIAGLLKRAGVATDTAARLEVLRTGVDALK